VTAGPKAWAAKRLRSVIDASVTSALEGVRDDLRQVGLRVGSATAALDEQRAAVARLQTRLEVLEHLARSIESEERANHQQIEDALDFLRLQHFAVREALDHLPGNEPSGPVTAEGA